MVLWHKMIARILGRNTQKTPTSLILDQMSEMRPLPLGVQEFEEWSDRIISGACLPASKDSLKFALAEMVMHLKPTEDHCSDGYFIKCLRKAASNQICYAKMEELRAKRKAELEAKESQPAQ